MTVSWSVASSSDGSGDWFVAEQRGLLSVFAAPGVTLPEPPAGLVAETVVHGWRQAIWVLDDDPIVDIDPPVATFRVTTVEVCTDMPRPLRAEVRRIMVDQLHLALTFGESSQDELVVDAEAHARQASVAWILAELREAFPDELWELPQPSMRPATVPDTLDEFLLCLPAAARLDAPDVEIDVDFVRTDAFGVRQVMKLLVVLVFERFGRAYGNVVSGNHSRLRHVAVEPEHTPEESVGPPSSMARV